MSAMTNQQHAKFVEDYQDGYPRFAALLAAHAPFLILRRFNRVRARLLLQKQYQVSLLEEKLDKIDQSEPCVVFLGTCQLDANTDRLRTLSELDVGLRDYDDFVERSRRMLSSDAAESRDIESLDNWLSAKGCIAREETEYLRYTRELTSLAPAKDNALAKVEIWVENLLIRSWRGFRDHQHYDLSRDPHVYLYSGPLIKRTARVLLLSLITSLLLLPVVICNVTTTISIRIVIIMVSTIIYLSILSELTRSRTMELVVAGATYATVLIVFVSGTDDTVPARGL